VRASDRSFSLDCARHSSFGNDTCAGGLRFRWPLIANLAVAVVCARRIMTPPARARGEIAYGATYVV
jgi:hypothetical protein